MSLRPKTPQRRKSLHSNCPGMARFPPKMAPFLKKFLGFAAQNATHQSDINHPTKQKESFEHACCILLEINTNFRTSNILPNHYHSLRTNHREIFVPHRSRQSEASSTSPHCPAAQLPPLHPPWRVAGGSPLGQHCPSWRSSACGYGFSFVSSLCFVWFLCVFSFPFLCCLICFFC